MTLAVPWYTDVSDDKIRDLNDLYHGFTYTNDLHIENHCTCSIIGKKERKNMVLYNTWYGNGIVYIEERIWDHDHDIYSQNHNAKLRKEKKYVVVQGTSRIP